MHSVCVYVFLFFNFAKSFAGFLNVSKICSSRSCGEVVARLRKGSNVFRYTEVIETQMAQLKEKRTW